MIKNKTSHTQNNAVLTYLRKRRNAKMTTEQICSGAKTIYGKNLTNTQVSKCLNRFSVSNLVRKIDDNGFTSDGRKAYRWSYIASKKS
jgi:hypothetical protein